MAANESQVWVKWVLLTAGTLCGYVQVPKEHLLHGMGTSDRVEMLRENVELHDQAPDYLGMLCEIVDPDAQDGTVPISSAILAHGGVSFAGDLSGRVDQPQLAGWWFGLLSPALSTWKGQIPNRFHSRPNC